MYEVKWKEDSKEFISLDDAMKFSKELNCFVTIAGNGMEIVGKFGVDSVENGKCPDGVDYTWNKTSRIGRVKKERA
jgi:hypothetical protein